MEQSLPLTIPARPRRRTAADWMIPAGLIALAAVPSLAGMLRMIGLARGQELVSGHARFAADPVPIVLHIVGATTFCIVGALQVSPGLRRRRPALHRRAGWVLVPAGMLAALSGMWMTISYPPAENDGPTLRLVRLVAGAAMVASLVVSVLAIRRRDFLAHGRWMTRAYALAIAAGTQTFLLLPRLILGYVETERSYAFLMAAGWLVNVIFAEWVIRRAAARATT